MDLKPLVEYFRDTEWSQELIREAQQKAEIEGRERGLQRGLEEGREQGLERGREQLLLALLRSRFGDSPQVRAAAHRLAGWNEEAAVKAITEADGPGSLLSADHAAGPRRSAPSHPHDAPGA